MISRGLPGLGSSCELWRRNRRVDTNVGRFEACRFQGHTVL
jgi:hypothetical protein